MKEYKLKKWYPSLPVDWKNTAVIVVEREHGYNLHPSLKVINLTEETIRYAEVNNPEFWEEVLPKKWEVLSFEYKDKGLAKGVVYSTLRKNGKYLNSSSPKGEGVYTLDNVLKASHWKIHKVKRLSDGVVFTLGDTVVRHADASCDTPVTTPRKISKLYFVDNVIKFDTGNKRDDKNYTLSVFSHVPKPIFTTADGVNAYDGFAVYQVSLVDKDYSMHLTKARVELTPVPSYFKYFSTRQAAEDFVIRRKPVLSAAEIDDLARSFVGSYNIEFHIALNKLTKKKLGF